MSEEQINIAIAEACGWVERDEPKGSANPKTWWHGPHRYPSNMMPIPDYLNDLNAMHEAEKVLVEMGVNKWWTYAGHILRHNPSPFGAETAIHATARQRAEAFLRTIGKWKEEMK